MERSAADPTEAHTIWRVDDGAIGARTLEIIGDSLPIAYVFDNPDALASILNGDRLVARVHYDGEQEDVFDLTRLRNTPVHDNLVHCGDY